jgi:hypothetical protein
MKICFCIYIILPSMCAIPIPTVFYEYFIAFIAVIV